MRTVKSCSSFFRIERTQSTPLTQNSCLVCFRSFNCRYQNSCETQPRGPFWTLVERKKIAVDFFEANAPNPPCLTQNSCPVCFRGFGFGHQNSCETRPQGPFWLHEERKTL